jgi:hypothetical protein
LHVYNTVVRLCRLVTVCTTRAGGESLLSCSQFELQQQLNALRNWLAGQEAENSITYCTTRALSHVELSRSRAARLKCQELGNTASPEKRSTHKHARVRFAVPPLSMYMALGFSSCSHIMCIRRCVRVEREPWRRSWAWGSYRERNQTSPTAVTWRCGVCMSLPSAILDKPNCSSPSCASNFHHFAAPWAPRGSLTGGHVKVVLAYGHSLSLDH